MIFQGIDSGPLTVNIAPNVRCGFAARQFFRQSFCLGILPVEMATLLAMGKLGGALLEPPATDPAVRNCAARRRLRRLRCLALPGAHVRDLHGGGCLLCSTAAAWIGLPRFQIIALCDPFFPGLVIGL